MSKEHATTAVSLPSVSLKVFGVQPDDQVGVLIEQVATGLFLDPSTKTFKNLAGIADPLLPLPAGSAGTPLAAIARLDLPIEPGKGWSDGRYTSTYFDKSVSPPRPFDEEVFDVVNAAWRPVTTTDNAVRLLAAQAGTTTVRDQLSKIDAIYRWVAAQPGFKA
jgi:hypothetical protein